MTYLCHGLFFVNIRKEIHHTKIDSNVQINIIVLKQCQTIIQLNPVLNGLFVTVVCLFGIVDFLRE